MAKARKITVTTGERTLQVRISDEILRTMSTGKAFTWLAVRANAPIPDERAQHRGA
jgi:hypothetical protein